jgi:hypothetical protein
MATLLIVLAVVLAIGFRMLDPIIPETYRHLPESILAFLAITFAIFQYVDADKLKRLSTDITGHVTSLRTTSDNIKTQVQTTSKSATEIDKNVKASADVSKKIGDKGYRHSDT